MSSPSYPWRYISAGSSTVAGYSLLLAVLQLASIDCHPSTHLQAHVHADDDIYLAMDQTS